MTSALIVTFLIANALFLAALIPIDYLRGKVELLSFRNFFIVGFIIFQLISASEPFIVGHFGMYSISDPAAVGIEFCLYVAIFIPLFLISYKGGWLVRRAAARTPAARGTPGSVPLLMLAAALLVMAVFFGYALGRISHVAILGFMASIGCSGMAAAAVGWVWGKRLYNPAMMVYGSIIIVFAMGIVVNTAFGRRELLAVLFGLLWGMYYSHWRYLRPQIILTRLAIVAIPAFFVVASFTSVRSSGEHNRTSLQHLEKMLTQTDLTKGTLLLIQGQSTGAVAMWCIDNYPENYEYRWFFTPIYSVTITIPRNWWPSKPDPLSILIDDQAGIRNVSDGMTLSTGIIGSAAAEGGWIAVIVYAVLSGLFVRYFDELTIHHASHIFILLPIGCNLGQILGLARGETSLFVNTYMLSFLICWALMSFFGMFCRSRGEPGTSEGDWDEDLDLPAADEYSNSPTLESAE